jgi:hypothetical protein
MDSTGDKYAECTRHGQKEDEKQSGPGEPAKLDPGIERKQQTQTARPRLVSAKLLTSCDFILI